MKIQKKQTNAHDCLICGVDNPYGVHASFYEMEDNTVVSLFTYQKYHQSYPERVHGGMIAAMIDETIGRAIWLTNPGEYACTLKLNIEYHKGVPYDIPLKCVAKIDHVDKIAFKGHAELQTMDGQMLCKGNGLYMFLKKEQISPDTNVKEEDLNTFIPDNLTEIN